MTISHLHKCNKIVKVYVRIFHEKTAGPHPIIVFLIWQFCFIIQGVMQNRVV